MKQLRMESTPSNGKTVQELESSFIRALKDIVDVDPDYSKQIAFNKESYPSVQFLQQNMFVIPVPFSKGQKNMLTIHVGIMTRIKNMI